MEEGRSQVEGRGIKTIRKKGQGERGVPRGPGSPVDQPALLPGSLPHPHWCQEGPGAQPFPKLNGGHTWLGRGRLSLMCRWHRGLTSHYLWGRRPPLLSPLPCMAIMTPALGEHVRIGMADLVQSRDSASHSLVSCCDPHTHPGRRQVGLLPHYMGKESSGVAGMVYNCGGAEWAQDKMSEN